MHFNLKCGDAAVTCGRDVIDIWATQLWYSMNGYLYFELYIDAVGCLINFAIKRGQDQDFHIQIWSTI